MGLLARAIEQRLAAELERRKVLVWYDPQRAWQPWVQQMLGGGLPGKAEVASVALDCRQARMVVFAGSYYELAHVCEPIVAGEEPEPLVVYLPGERQLDNLSPLRELECLGGESDSPRFELGLIAREALGKAGLSESKIDELLKPESTSFEYLDAVRIEGKDGALPLAPVFGSSREVDIFPAFLADPSLRTQAAKRGLLRDVAQLSAEGLGLAPNAINDAEALALELQRLLLAAELRSDLSGAAPLTLSRFPQPETAAHVDQVRKVCARLRSSYPEAYEAMADRVEKDLGLADAKINALALGNIDTFRFEERRLLAACDDLLADGKLEEALKIVRERSRSFWTSIDRYAMRRASWQACEELVGLAMAIDDVERALKSPPLRARDWVEAYARPGGWHRMDQRFRQARYRMTTVQEEGELEHSADKVFAGYDALLERMAIGFFDSLEQVTWQVADVTSQSQVYERGVARRRGRVAYIVADAMRYEMGASLAELVKAAGAQALRLEPAIAMTPTITDVGMVALLPGAERSFTIARSGKGIAGVIEKKALAGVAARMEHAKAMVPGLVEMTLDRLLHELTPTQVEKAVRDAPVVIIRSQEIDGAGESLPDGVARRVMGTVLEDLRKGVLRLAGAGIEEFVITADHGHLYGERRGDDMKIDPPQAGQMVDLHRRCWLGQGGSTPPACARIPAADMGYKGTELHLVVPRGTGVFKAGGSLSFHHGGLSLQELVIPVLSFELKARRATRGKVKTDLVALESVPKEITNLIFSLAVRRTDLFAEPLQVRLIVEGTVSNKDATVGQAEFATRGWDAAARVLTLEGHEAVSVGFKIEDETVKELRVLVVQVGTDRTLKDTPPIPVFITR